LGIKQERPKTKDQKTLAQAQSDLLDTQTMAADLFEQNTAKDQQILDLQTIVATLTEKAGV